MAKTAILNSHGDIVYGFEMDTTVVSAAIEVIPGDPEADPPVPDSYYVRVTPASLAGIAFSTLLEIDGVGPVAVTGVDGSSFTYSTPLIAPAYGARIKSPWLFLAPDLRFCRENNSITLTYYLPSEHDLYFSAEKTADSGLIAVVVDGQSAGAFDLFNATTGPASVLLQSDLGPGYHTVGITAQIAPPDVFVYFRAIELFSRVAETGGEYPHKGPVGLNDSANNFVGTWAISGEYAYTTLAGDSVFFYPQLTAGGQVKARFQKDPVSAQVDLYVNGSFRRTIDLYSDPAQTPGEEVLLDAGSDAPGAYKLELRHTGTKNPSSGGYFFYFQSAVVIYARTDLQALTLCADYLKETANLRGDGSFPDVYNSQLINFEANSLYACMGLLAAYEVLGAQAYLDAVKHFLIWWASVQMSAPGDSFTDGAWHMGYKPNAGPPPGYSNGIDLTIYKFLGVSEVRWGDAQTCLPAFVLWWYWKLSGDAATKNALLPAFRTAVDGFLKNNYDPETGFFFAAWWNQTAPTIFLYHDAIRRYGPAGTLLEEHNDHDVAFFTYAPFVNWASYSPQEAFGADEHYTLIAQSTVQFSLTLNEGDTVRWQTQTAWNVGIADVLISTDGTNFSPLTTVDGYTADIQFKDFLLYTAPSGGTKHFRIRHSGTINAAGNTAPGWYRFQARYSAGQNDVLHGLIAMWLLTRAGKYARLAALLIRRFPDRYWSDADGRWLISLDGPAPGTENNFWFVMPHGYSPFAQRFSRLFQPSARFAAGLAAMEPYQDAEGAFNIPGYTEREFIYASFYVLGQNQLAAKTDAAKYELAKEYIKAGQWLQTLNGQPVGGIVFSKRYPYLYTTLSGFACLALAGAVDSAKGKGPFTEPLRFSETRMVMPL